ncbi:putative deacylase [Aequitasia blattaphilus]|uniref:Succinylglutamate desuccinylase/aspartoacylase family protein n=1 Tax=Aequitasia blattaphilus TaxID=2949332 RepID=A0ABT1EFF4_9FIRM|nr:succinylglutamate desuccinylase/aspartoacylase family protein [Aequitasia blattaphilus]MCP1103566.1 succinylglutamate desuccinylase/aspartoacylase family protein [Aequitasia blattaphilus]MCR8616206.1 succinylglutamate desuccinylase/aspartoacylase family protein [Aequitasia blattaphilus]
MNTYLKVYDDDIYLPATIIEGEREGKTILITAGVHSTEYVSIEASIQLAKELEKEDTRRALKGKIILIHATNYSGFCKGNTLSQVPEDGQNLNRVFPGNREGSVSEKVACYMVQEMVFL